MYFFAFLSFFISFFGNLVLKHFRVIFHLSKRDLKMLPEKITNHSFIPVEVNVFLSGTLLSYVTVSLYKIFSFELWSSKMIFLNGNKEFDLLYLFTELNLRTFLTCFVAWRIVDINARVDSEAGNYIKCIRLI